jgi:hypothetical protein
MLGRVEGVVVKGITCSLEVSGSRIVIIRSRPGSGFDEFQGLRQHVIKVEVGNRLSLSSILDCCPPLLNLVPQSTLQSLPLQLKLCLDKIIRLF